MRKSSIAKMRVKGVFVTGTDTGVGKTVICGLFARYLSDNGYRVVTQKWAQTGSAGFPKDIDVHLRLMGRTRRYISDYLAYAAPYCFKFASSPHLAARLERKRISPKRIKRGFGVLARDFDFVVVEGTGGALVPLDKKMLVIDIAQELNLPVVIVAKNRLGAINHTLLTVEAVKARRMRILGVIFNTDFKNKNRVILDDNPKIIRGLAGEAVLGNLPWLKSRHSLYKAFLPIGRRILAGY